MNDDCEMIRPRALWKLLGISAATGWRMVKCGALPAPVRVSVGAVAWRRSEIDAWVSSLPRTNAGDGEAPREGAAA